MRGRKVEVCSTLFHLPAGQAPYAEIIKLLPEGECDRYIITVYYDEDQTLSVKAPGTVDHRFDVV